MNQEWNLKSKNNQMNRGSLTLEASLVLVMFLIAYMAVLSIINMYRAQVLIQNAANQTAVEIAQYTFILQKAGLVGFDDELSEQVEGFNEKTQKTIGTVFAFFEATANGIDAGKEAVDNLGKQTFPQELSELEKQLADLEADAGKMEQHFDEIKKSADDMIDVTKEYFEDPKGIFNGLLAVLKKGAIDTVKIVVATPISKSLMKKYLSAYPDGYLEGLGVVNGEAGINYFGSSILLDNESIEVCATYKMRIDFPFLDLFEYQLKTTASTRAWIGDGTTNGESGTDK